MAQERVFVGSGRGFIVAGVLLLLVGIANVVIGTGGKEELMVYAGGGLAVWGALMIAWPKIRPFRITITDEAVFFRSQRIPLEHLIVGDVEWRQSGNTRVRVFELQWLDDSDAIKTRLVPATAFPNLAMIQSECASAAAGYKHNRT